MEVLNTIFNKAIEMEMDTVGLISCMVLLIQFITLIILILRIIFIKLKSGGRERYWDNTPDEIPPYAISYMLYEKPQSDDCIAAEIAGFINKGILKSINTNGQVHLEIMRYPCESDNLWDYQYGIFRKIVQPAANSEGIITIESFRNSRNKVVGLSLVGIIMKIREELIEKGYLKKETKINDAHTKIVTLGAFSVIGWILLCAEQGTFAFHKLFFVIIPFFFLLCCLAVKDMKSQLTKKGKKSYTAWMSFRAFLKNYGKFEDRGTRDVVIWRKFLVYACAFDLSDKLTDEVNDVMTKEIVLSLKKSLKEIGLNVAKGVIKSEFGLNKRR